MISSIDDTIEAYIMEEIKNEAGSGKETFSDFLVFKHKAEREFLWQSSSFSDRFSVM